jgi:hypothetical protein
MTWRGCTTCRFLRRDTFLLIPRKGVDRDLQEPFLAYIAIDRNTIASIIIHVLLYKTLKEDKL